MVTSARVRWRSGSHRRFAPPSRRDWLDCLSAVAAALAIGLSIQSVLIDESANKTEITHRTSPGSGPEAGPVSRETIVAGYVGAPFTHASDLHFVKPGTTDLTVHDVQWQGRPFKSPIYYGLRASRWSAESPLGAMVDFTHSKAIATPDQQVRFSGTRNAAPAPAPAKIIDTFRHMEFSHGHNTLTMNALWRLWPTGLRIVPYVGAGGGINLPHTEVQFADEKDRTYEYQFSGPSGQVLAGVEIRLPSSSVFIEYKFTLARYTAPLTGRDSRHSYGPDDLWAQFMDWWHGRSPAYGTVTTTLASHQLIGGIGYRHGSPLSP